MIVADADAPTTGDDFYGRHNNRAISSTAYGGTTRPFRGGTASFDHSAQ